MRIRAALLALSAAATPLVPPLALAAAVYAVAPSAEAATVREATLRHLVEVADVVVEATPQESTSVWEDLPGVGRRIVTYTRLSIGEAVYGTTQKQLWVRTLGGVVGDIGQRVEGEAVLVPGERSLLFLTATGSGTHTVAELAQGHYLVKQEKAGEGPRVRPSPRHGNVVPVRPEERERAKVAREVLAGRELAEAVTVIRAERKAAGR